MKKLLIANRGEIARRIIRTARSMEIETVALFSDADSNAPYVREADQAFRLRGITPAETYLDVDAILQVIAISGADAVHPGYGFLSENGEFARRVIGAGVIFVGPSPEAIEKLGSKTRARELAIANNVPIMPGTESALESAEEAKTTAEEIGYPVLLKAAAGGGGKGMRVVERPEDLESALRAARGESRTAFGSDEIFLEKYLQEPRHIEVQVVADKEGNVVVFGERECSIQRRHQKVVEESPSPAITDSIRSDLYAAATRLVSGAEYYNAGTLEFLLGPDGQFYFLEVNTRLQVEHPVTEMVTGTDLVELQLRVARGESLAHLVGNVESSGHAIECRVCAENPFDDFFPSTGFITELHEPSGPGIRVDSGAYSGMEVSLHYDPMISKLIVHGQTRQEAIDRMHVALAEYHIAGIRTTIPFCKDVMKSEAFVNGEYSTRFVSLYWQDPEPSFSDETAALAAASSAVVDQRIERRYKNRVRSGRNGS